MVTLSPNLAITIVIVNHLCLEYSCKTIQSRFLEAKVIEFLTLAGSPQLLLWTTFINYLKIYKIQNSRFVMNHIFSCFKTWFRLFWKSTGSELCKSFSVFYPAPLFGQGLTFHNWLCPIIRVSKWSGGWFQGPTNQQTEVDSWRRKLAPRAGWRPLLCLAIPAWPHCWPL